MNYIKISLIKSIVKIYNDQAVNKVHVKQNEVRIKQNEEEECIFCADEFHTFAKRFLQRQPNSLNFCNIVMSANLILNLC